MTDTQSHTTIAFEQCAWTGLANALDADVESAWMLGARVVEGPWPSNSKTLLVRHVFPIPDDSYEVRAHDRLSIRSLGWVPALGAVADDGCVPVFVHSHPSHEPRPSKWDNQVDAQIHEVCKVRTDAGMYASLVIGGTSGHPTFTGHLFFPNGSKSDVERLRSVGQRLRILGNWSEAAVADPPAVFDRQVRAFGPDGQRTLARMRVGVVGAGGTGSAVAEQLIRLGVTELVVLDHQTLDDTNVTRVYGSGIADADVPKVDLVGRQAERIGLDTVIKSVQQRVTDQDAATMLSQCDIVMGCTDDNAGRNVLTRMPQYLLQLLIDCGVTIDSRQGQVNDVFGRISVVTPTSPCLVCMGDIDPQRSAAELLSPEDYQRLAHEGYAPELDTRDPAVVVYTTAIASAAVNELLIRLFDLEESDPPNRLLHRFIDRSVSRSRRERIGAHSCGDVQRLAKGRQAPFLDWGWPSDA